MDTTKRRGPVQPSRNGHAKPASKPKYKRRECEEELANLRVVASIVRQIRHWMKKLKELDLKSARPTTRHDLLRGICRTGDQAAILSKLLYWFEPSDPNNPDSRPRASDCRKGFLYVYKSHAELAVEHNLTYKQAKVAIAWLVHKDQGYVERKLKHREYGRKVCNHYRLNGQVILTALEAWHKADYARRQKALASP